MTIEQTVKNVLEDFADFPRDSISGTDTLDGLGLDSQDIVVAVMTLEDILGVEVPDDRVRTCVTVQHLVDTVVEVGRK